MAFVMTIAGSTGCNHGGTATLTSSATLKVNGSAVLVAKDVTSWSILPGCSQTDTSKSMVVCTNFLSFTGQSSKLKVDGSPVVLDSFSGVTNGKPLSDSKSAQAGQSKLSA